MTAYANGPGVLIYHLPSTRSGSPENTVGGSLYVLIRMKRAPEPRSRRSEPGSVQGGPISGRNTGGGDGGASAGTECGGCKLALLLPARLSHFCHTMGHHGPHMLRATSRLLHLLKKTMINAAGTFPGACPTAPACPSGMRAATNRIFGRTVPGRRTCPRQRGAWQAPFVPVAHALAAPVQRHPGRICRSPAPCRLPSCPCRDCQDRQASHPASSSSRGWQGMV